MALFNGSSFLGKLFSGSIFGTSEDVVIQPEESISQGGFWIGKVIGKVTKKKKRLTGIEALEKAREVIAQEAIEKQAKEVIIKPQIIEPLPVQYAAAVSSVNKMLDDIAKQDIYDDDLNALAIILALNSDELLLIMAE